MKKFMILTDIKLEQLIQERLLEYKKSFNKNYQKEILKKQMDIAALQSQINPHFLYNSLECIRGQAILKDAPEIAEITHALSKFFRYSINTKSDIVTLEEELDSINNYLKIQQYRFKDRFSLEIEYDKDEPDILEALLPKLTLQPIIENAITHGFQQLIKNAHIKVEIILTKKNLNITISDNGEGMDKETLIGLNERIQSDLNMDLSGIVQRSKGNGIAMYNVNKRIKLIYGDEFGLTVSSIKSLGTDVEIHIPFKIGDIY